MNFEGNTYRTAVNWNSYIKPTDEPINYLEIGVNKGYNLFSVADSYAKHPDSKIYGIDPWEDYEDYNEYKTKQDSIYSAFLNNLAHYPHNNKINAIRGYSHTEIPRFEDNFFDIIYIDGNHNPEYILEDAVLSFRKLKVNGIMIFDDYDWTNTDEEHNTIHGVEAFLRGYQNRIYKERVVSINSQVFVTRKN